MGFSFLFMILFMYFGVALSFKARSDGNNKLIGLGVLMLVLGLLMGIFFFLEFWDAMNAYTDWWCGQIGNG